MNKPFYILFFVFASVFCNAQTNLVYNGDFEIYDTCPIGPSVPWDHQITHCLGWDTPTGATSDYLNVCNTGLVGVPSNGIGYEYARSGNGYCGFLAMDLSSGIWMEYIQSKLSQPMLSGHTYQVSFYVSLSDYSQYAVSNIGAYLSNTAISRTDTYPFSYYSPQIKNPAGSFITDTTGWVLISGDFKANGNEQYITIGNYSDSTLENDTLEIQPSSTPNSYYYVEDVSIIDLEDALPISNVFTPNNDGINDLFFITGIEEGDKYTIYDRWGLKVFEGSYNIGWDGKTSAGINCNNGVYYYISEQKSKQTKKGFIQLLR
ncbi:MAG: hypothetical protein JWP12_1911 [Bacteroidetes bacterium]|nr:hypothetical protein [Bacteroidota bacterium]